MIKTHKKINLAIIFGGKSAEHEVSIKSTQNIASAVNKNRYNISLIGISRNGDWFYFTKKELLSEKPLFLKKKYSGGARVMPLQREGNFFLKIGAIYKKIDVIFPVLHGPFGEDGTMQGLLKFFNVPFVGSSILGSAVGMDKDVSKRLLKEAGIPVVKFLTYRSNEKNKISFNKIKKDLGLPFFVKPANLGSSVGVSKVKNKNEFQGAIKLAFSYDKKIIIEKFIKGREIECSVLGNENPIVSISGEIVPIYDFYSYEAKYLDKNGAKLIIPANLSKFVAEKVKKMAIKTFKTLCCEGMGRIDFFITEKDEIFVNEINTIPGFTSISMYPKLFEYSGISLSKLIDMLIELAFERYKEENKIKIFRDQ